MLHEHRNLSPLPSHRELKTSSLRNEALTRALSILRSTDINAYSLTKEYCHHIHWMELRPEFINQDDRITSASFPGQPFHIYISNKALLHIPPNSLFSEPSFFALAENIFHEAIHQKVNQQILTGEIFSEHFDSRTAPKIHIKWRSGQALRNQYWEIDRTLHAACVYSGLIELRKKVLQQELSGEERAVFMAALAPAGACNEFLLAQLQRVEFKNYFKPKGLELICELGRRSYV
jgi:hypothetical protein